MHNMGIGNEKQIRCNKALEQGFHLPDYFLWVSMFNISPSWQINTKFCTH